MRLLSFVALLALTAPFAGCKPKDTGDTGVPDTGDTSSTDTSTTDTSTDTSTTDTSTDTGTTDTSTDTGDTGTSGPVAIPMVVSAHYEMSAQFSQSIDDPGNAGGAESVDIYTTANDAGVCGARPGTPVGECFKVVYNNDPDDNGTGPSYGGFYFVPIGEQIANGYVNDVDVPVQSGATEIAFTAWVDSGTQDIEMIGGGIGFYGGDPTYADKDDDGNLWRVSKVITLTSTPTEYTLVLANGEIAGGGTPNGYGDWVSGALAWNLGNRAPENNTEVAFYLDDIQWRVGQSDTGDTGTTDTGDTGTSGNLLANPSFESDDGGTPPRPTDWLVYPGDRTNYAIVKDGDTLYNSSDTWDDPNGTQSVKLYGLFTGTGNETPLYQEFDGSAGQNYTLTGSAYMHADDPITATDTEAYLSIKYFDGSYNFLGADDSSKVTSTSPTNTWIDLTATGTAPAATAHVQGAIEYSQCVGQTNCYTGGSVYFDDLSLVQQ